MTRRDAPADARNSGGPQRLRSPGGWVAPVAACIGLVLIAWLTFVFLTGNVRVPGASGSGGDGANATPAPSNVVIVDPRTNVPGGIVYVKAGNVWIQSGREARQLTTSGIASMASWAPDGQSVIYVESHTENGFPPFFAPGRKYVMSVPTVMRIAADGSGKPQAITTGRVQRGRYTWFYWIRDPVLSPDGRTLAMVTDATDPTTTDVVVQLLNLTTKKLTKPRLAENSPLGHQDPAWRPDGKLLLYVKNARDGAKGTPTINTYDPATGRSTTLTGPGYISPSWSRDARFIAATRTDNFGTNIVILDARTGTELKRLTTDGQSWSPVWSPRGDAIAYLHVEGEIIDLRMIPLTGEAPNWTPGAPLNLTEVSGLDGISHPDWFIPADQLPALPTATPSTEPSASSGP
jgi:dipeptidyl aminopeptidase/acylaminoacyl peptidase